MSKVFKIGIVKDNNQEIQEVKEINLSVGKELLEIDIFMSITKVVSN